MKKIIRPLTILYSSLLLLSISASAYYGQMSESSFHQGYDHRYSHNRYDPGYENQNATINADFSETPTSGNASLTVQFNDLSTGNPGSWLWDFGDSSTSTLPNPSHTYTQAGTYTVTLTATNAADSNTASDYIVVTAPTSPVVTSPVVASVAASPVVTSPVASSVAISPVAAFTASPTSGNIPLTVTFTDTSTESPTSWAWNFGDSSAVSTDQNPTHIYTQAGTYTVTLAATNAAGTNTTFNYIVVTASTSSVAMSPAAMSLAATSSATTSPAATFTALPTSGNTPLTVTFTDTSTGSPTSWAWDFGDGSAVSTDRSPVHTFTTAGNYNVTLTASNVNGSNSYSTQIVASSTAVQSTDNSSNYNNCSYNNCNNCTYNNTKPACSASKTVPKNLKVLCHGKAPRRVHFIDRSKRHVSCLWDFGDGKASRCKSVFHTYKTPGKYLFKLTYKTVGHCTKTVYGGYIVVEDSSSQTSTTTPTPTPTPTPTITPTPTPAITPTPTPEVTEPKPIELSDTGQKATQTFQLEQGLSEFSMTYNSSNNFIVWLIDGKTGQNVELLANKIGSFSGSKAVGITSKGDYILNIQASGPWTVTINQPRQAATQSTPLTLQGTGQQASQMFILESGLKTFTMKNDGSSNFIVWLMDNQGNHVSMLANQIGNFNGSTAVGIPQSGTYLLDIDADGKWEVSIK